ncbi:MAG: RNA 2',3'-cyclic phosphodiesterase [Thermoleophilaceae bacterium]
MAKRLRSETGRAAPGGPRARLFLALEVPEPERAALARWRDELVAGREDLRPVAPQALHLTLVFLGWQAERDVSRIAELTAGAVEGLRATRLVPTAVKPIPPRRPRLFALDLAEEGGGATAVHRALSDALEEARLYRPEKRPFWPHVTLARVKREARAGPLEARALPGPFEAAGLTLYRSTLRPQGALYEPLWQAKLA